MTRRLLHQVLAGNTSVLEQEPWANAIKWSARTVGMVLASTLPPCTPQAWPISPPGRAVIGKVQDLWGAQLPR
jgi:hypothetical protein